MKTLTCSIVPILNLSVIGFFSPDLVQNCNLLKFRKWEFIFKEEKGHLTSLSKFVKLVMLNFKLKKKMKTCLKPEYELKERTTQSGRISKPPTWKFRDLPTNWNPATVRLLSSMYDYRIYIFSFLISYYWAFSYFI